MWELYWLTRVDGISVVLCIVLLISVVATVSRGVCYLSVGGLVIFGGFKNILPNIINYAYHITSADCIYSAETRYAAHIRSWSNSRLYTR